MEHRRHAPTPALPPPLLLLLLAGLTVPHAAAAVAAAPSDPTRLQLGADYKPEILAQVDLMNELLGNMTDELNAAKPSSSPSPTTLTTPTTAPDDDGDTDPDSDTRLQQNPFSTPLDLLPHGHILSKRSDQPPPLLPRRLALERQRTLSATDLPKCQKDEVNTALNDSATVLDEVAGGKFTPDQLTELEKQNGVLGRFFTDCSLASMDPDDTSELLDNVAAVQTHAAAAKAAAEPAEIGLEVGSAFMVVLITLSCLIALVSLVGLAVLGFRYTTTSTTTTTKGSGGGGGGGRDAKAGWSARGGGLPNPAYQPTDPPGSLHQARNERWQRPSGAGLEAPHRAPAGSKSTLGRMWGGVVAAYQRSRDSVAEPRSDGARGYPSDEPRREPRAATPPPCRYSPRPTRRASPPPRRASPPPRRASPPPRRASPPSRRASPPPRRASPPPRRHSPSPPMEGGDNWAYGPTGRSKSTDSPFASAW